MVIRNLIPRRGSSRKSMGNCSGVSLVVGSRNIYLLYQNSYFSSANKKLCVMTGKSTLQILSEVSFSRSKRNFLVIIIRRNVTFKFSPAGIIPTCFRSVTRNVMASIKHTDNPTMLIVKSKLPQNNFETTSLGYKELPDLTNP